MATYESARVGPNEFSFPSFPIQTIVRDYAFDDLEGDPVSTLKRIVVPIEGDITVTNIVHLVMDDFNGGTVDNIGIGDSGGTFEFSGGTNVAPVTGDMVNTAGKYFADPDFISVSHNVRNSGEGRLFVFYIDKRTNWRTYGNI
jgi:hypothetical protein